MADKNQSMHQAITDLQLRGRKCRQTPRNNPSDKNEICYCQKHNKDDDTESKLDINTHMDNDLITKLDYGLGTPKYIRCDIETPPRNLEKLLVHIWKIKPPTLLLAICGGAKYFKMSEGLEEKFCNKIINATRQSSAWLFTSGFNTGIVQMIGRALNKIRLTRFEENITAIAITKYGCITNDSKIIQKIEPILKGHSEPRKRGKHGLEPNHSHYILLDDGTRYQYQGMQDRAPVLMKTISYGQNSQTDSIPAITLLVEGGRDSILSVYCSLFYGIPVIIVKGSGRLADFLACWISILDNDQNHVAIGAEKNHDDRSKESSSTENYKRDQDKILLSDSDKAELDSMFKLFAEDIRKDLRQTLKHNSEEPWQWNDDKRLEKRVDSIWHHVLFCLQPAIRSNIFQFNLTGNDDLMDTLLRTIYHVRRKTIHSDFKHPSGNNEKLQEDQKKKYTDARKNLDQQMLRLALQWNCLEVAKDLIVRGSIENIDLADQATDILSTLSNNLPAFLHYLITLELALPRLIFNVDSNTQNINSKVYNETLMKHLYSFNGIVAIHKKNGCLLYDILRLHSNSGPKLKQLFTKHLNNILNELIGDIMEKLYPEDDNQNQNLNGTNVINIQGEELPAPKYSVRNYTFRDLFIWSLLMNYIDMAKMLLSHLNHRICAALIARKILMSYRSKYVKYSDKHLEYQQLMDYFEEYAIQCITLCQKNDPNKACKLVLRECEMFGNVTCLQIAIHAKAKHFISHPCCVQAISNVWYRSIDIDKTGYVWLVVDVLTCGLTTILTKTSEETEEEEQRQQSNTNQNSLLEPYGIPYSDLRDYRQVQPVSSRRSLTVNLANLVEFHQCPIVKFSYDCIHYLLIVLIFSYVLLFQFDPPTMQIPSIPWTEILLIILMSSMLISEIRLFFEHDTSTLIATMKHYHLYPVRTYGVTLSYLLFYAGLGLRFTKIEPSGNFFYARIVMAYSLQFWWLRALKYIGAIEFFGPPIVAIRKMLKDLIFFACLITIVMSGYGTASRSIAYYGNITFNADGIFHDIVYPVYYLLYIQLDDELTHLENARGTSWSIATHILLAFNMLLMAILLINLLIAMFNKRFDKIYDEAKIIWHYHQYQLVRDYFDRALLLPPISVIIDLYNLFGMFCHRMLNTRYFQRYYQRKRFKMITRDSVLRKSLDAFEGASTYEYAQAEAPIGTKKTSNVVESSNSVVSSQHICKEILNKSTKTIENQEKSLRTMFNEHSTIKSSLDVIEAKLTMITK
ncbi:hypothetical protein I4U23_003533 [Adineta vaga]|nr:hypothetical protein I4U23_003533 [Adineta vaga]